jgi:hypothetical protein
MDFGYNCSMAELTTGDGWKLVSSEWGPKKGLRPGEITDYSKLVVGGKYSLEIQMGGHVNDPRARFYKKPITVLNLPHPLPKHPDWGPCVDVRFNSRGVRRALRNTANQTRLFLDRMGNMRLVESHKPK